MAGLSKSHRYDQATRDRQEADSLPVEPETKTAEFMPKVPVGYIFHVISGLRRLLTKWCDYMALSSADLLYFSDNMAL